MSACNEKQRKNTPWPYLSDSHTTPPASVCAVAPQVKDQRQSVTSYSDLHIFRMSREKASLDLVCTLLCYSDIFRSLSTYIIGWHLWNSITRNVSLGRIPNRSLGLRRGNLQRRGQVTWSGRDLTGASTVKCPFDCWHWSSQSGVFLPVPLHLFTSCSCKSRIFEHCALTRTRICATVHQQEEEAQWPFFSLFSSVQRPEETMEATNLMKQTVMTTTIMVVRWYTPADNLFVASGYF